MKIDKLKYNKILIVNCLLFVAIFDSVSGVLGSRMLPLSISVDQTVQVVVSFTNLPINYFPQVSSDFRL